MIFESLPASTLQLAQAPGESPLLQEDWTCTLWYRFVVGLVVVLHGCAFAYMVVVVVMVGCVDVDVVAAVAGGLVDSISRMPLYLDSWAAIGVELVAIPEYCRGHGKNITIIS